MSRQLPSHDMIGAQTNHILRLQKELAPTNTQKAYNPKKEEFRAFCDAIYSTDDFPYLVTEPKLFQFAYYHCFRTPKGRGGRQSKRGSSGQPKFDLEEYREVTTRFHSLIPTAQVSEPSFTRTEEQRKAQGMEVLGFESVNQHVCAVIELWREQYAEGSNRFTREQIRSPRVNALLEIARKRKPIVDKAMYKEKLQHKMSPYRALDDSARIEQFLWEKDNKKRGKAMASLRDRYTFLHTLSGLIRAESMWKGELSDCSDFMYHQRKEPHAYHIGIMQILRGKRNQANRIFGRMMRHRKADFCALGAFALYLAWRFELTKEPERFDFTSNDRWYDIKLLVDHKVTWETNTTPMTEKQYGNAIKNACKTLGIPANHFAHWGRAEGNALLEMEEVDKDHIDLLGYWNMDVHDTAYSKQMPLPAMRVAAGFDKERGSYYIPRSQYLAPTELANQVFPWIEDAERKLVDSEGPDDLKTTARGFLDMLKNCRQVLLQDAAILMDAGRKHIVFDQLPVFRTPEFAAFKTRIVSYVQEAEKESPRNASMEVVLPGVNGKFDQLIGTQQGHGQQLQRLESSVGYLGTAILGFLNHLGSYQPPISATSPLTSVAQSQAMTASRVAVGTMSEVGAATCTITYEPPASFKSVTDIYNIWYGVGAAQPGGLPAGGISELESTPGLKKWRSHWKSDLRSKRLNRMRCIATETKRLSELEGWNLLRALSVMDSVFSHGKIKRSLSLMENAIRGRQHSEVYTAAQEEEAFIDAESQSADV
jgi:hypothetical protein